MRSLLCLMTLTLLTSVEIDSRVFAQGAAQKDDKRADARSANDEAERLRKVGTAESLHKAMDKYEEALSLWRYRGSVRRGETLTNSAEVLNSLGEKQKALLNFQKALSLWKEASDGKGQAIALSGSERFITHWGTTARRWVIKNNHSFCSDL